MRIAITGHRPHRLGNDYDLTSPLIQKIKKRIIEIVSSYHSLATGRDEEFVLISGMALGIDTLFAQIAIENSVPFIAAVPFAGQEVRWPQKSQHLYKTILQHPLCTIHIVSEGGYSSYKMQVRNEWMVDNSDLLIAVWDGSEGGTGNCVKYAQKQNKKIIQINPTTLL